MKRRMNIFLKPCSIGEHQERTAKELGLGCVAMLRKIYQYGFQFLALTSPLSAT